ncbi:DUF418 domain-containing protein [Sphingomicrobium clamense]|uniref:DUF418 domain-containing protein n=1 Tax=Sphingomicrobium clamense TaxID=2851013 RepID=A0ABS6V3E0_9SPHN|nr:DUF418 domain-containing protein [Sphingomicrobium sp. B8]MBW0144072.1 DUF418 domain-containing protein [Sphingomicrobium sp. B8]
MTEGHVAPITSSERIGELDALRGFALLGVFIANYVFFAFYPFASMEVHREAWSEDPANVLALQATLWLVSDKANTLFGVLFGMGFWVQLSRMKARTSDANSLYLRRLTILLGIGAINLYLLWPWDILFVYAIAGFLLFALRGLSLRAMAIAGLVLMLFSRPVVKTTSRELGILGRQEGLVYNPDAQASRFDTIINGSYADWVREFAFMTHEGFFLSGVLISWILYALGRFLIGAWIARQGWLERIAELRPRIGRIALVVLPLGLALEYVHMAVNNDMMELPDLANQAVHMVGLVLAALGYATALLWLYHSKSLGWLPRLFAPTGRMALTNYLAHGILFTLVLAGFGPGLALAGSITPIQTLMLAVGVFVALSVFSHFWLRTYRYGPLEYIWRTLTYGSAPQFRRQPAIAR